MSEHDGFDEPWWRYPILRISRAGAGFALAHTGWIGERTVGIDVLMLAAAAGSVALGLLDEAAFLCVQANSPPRAAFAPDAQDDLHECRSASPQRACFCM